MRRILLTLSVSALSYGLASAQTATSLSIVDTRSTATTPDTYSANLIGSFKNANALGLPNVGSLYYSLIGFTGWFDNSGGKSHELAFSDDSRIFYRSGNRPTWESWLQIPLMDQNGNLGIGTTAPAAKLHVFGVSILAGSATNIDPAGPAVNANVLANTGQMLIGWNREGGPGETDFISNQGAGATGGFAFYNHDNSNSETQLMWIQGNGSVAIGTRDPKGYKLAVNGSAIATSMTVKVNSNWPDYVFKKDYALPTLTEVKSYIDQNHHLPDMPSEQDVIKDGINLGEMNKLLTKKVEELTLYLIEKDKQLSEQQKKSEEQDLRIAALEAALSKLTSSSGSK